MNSKENPEDFYNRFLEQLEESQNWPGLYMFKFIVKSGSQQIEKLKDLFGQPQQGVSLTSSSNNRYESLTITIQMKSPQAVVDIYKEAAGLEGVIVL